MFYPKNGRRNIRRGDALLNYKQNSYIIRLADTYLMEAEALGGTGAKSTEADE